MAITLTLITFGFFVAWFPFFYSMTEGVFFNIKRPGFKVTIVMFYFNLLWDSVVYAMRTPAIHKLILHSFVGRRLITTYNSNSTMKTNCSNAQGILSIFALLRLKANLINLLIAVCFEFRSFPVALCILRFKTAMIL